MDEDELNAQLDRVLIGGRERRRIVLVDSDDAWPARFERERRRIVAALGSVARRIEHIGSTAVPGLAAKPVVDVLVTVDDVDDERSYVSPLERAGYVLRVREPGHRMLRTPDLDVHLHIWSEGDSEVQRHLAFRDRLRACPADREDYERLKRDLAAKEWDDPNHYAAAKGPLVEAILTWADRARRAATSDGTARADRPRRAVI